jgi:hypothetical protein
MQICAQPIAVIGAVLWYNVSGLDGRGRCIDDIFIERLWRSPKQESV